MDDDVSNEAKRSLVAASARFPGFRFSPTDEELISYYLKMKMEGSQKCVEIVPEIEICRYEPWDLPGKAVIQSDSEWFFFSPRGRKYPNGSQSKRATEFGYWKATGKEQNVKSGGANVIGTKRTLVFHLGRAPKGRRTEWIMHEYCTQGNSQDTLVVCRVRKNSDFRTKQGSNQDTVSQKGLSVTSNNTNEPGMASGPNNSHIGVSNGERADDGSCSRKYTSSHDSYSIEQNGDGFESDGKVPHKDGDCDDFYADILNDDIVKLFDESSLTTSPIYQPFTSSIFNTRTEQLPSSIAPQQGVPRRRVQFEPTKVDTDKLKMHLDRPERPCFVTTLTSGKLTGKTTLITLLLLTLMTLLTLFLLYLYPVQEIKVKACARFCTDHKSASCPS